MGRGGGAGVGRGRGGAAGGRPRGRRLGGARERRRDRGVRVHARHRAGQLPARHPDRAPRGVLVGGPDELLGGAARRRSPMARADGVSELRLDPVADDLGRASGESVLLFVNGMGGTPLSELFGV